MITSPTPTTTTNKPTGAMALLEKYATLNKCIESTRNQTTQSQSELDSTQLSIQDLIDQSDEMSKDIIEVDSDIQILQTDLKEVTRKFSSVDRVRMECEQRRDSVVRELGMVNQMRENGRKEFLNKCKEFRTVCKSVKLAFSSLTRIPGENKRKRRQDATVLAYFGCGHQAFLSSDDDDDTGEDSMSDEISIDKDTRNTSDDDDKHRTRRQVIEDGTSSSTSTLSTSVTCSLSTEDRKNNSMLLETNPIERRKHKSHIPSSNLKMSANTSMERVIDDEMNQSKLDYKESAQALTEAKAVLEEISGDRSVFIHRANDREKKLSQQRQQLERVKADANEMEKELEELENNTIEARQMGEAFAKDASRRRKTGNNYGCTASNANTQNGKDRSKQSDQYGFASDNQHTLSSPESAVSTSHHKLDESQNRYSITPSPYASQYKTCNEKKSQLEDKHEYYHTIENFKQKYSSSNTRITPNNPYKKQPNPYSKRGNNGINHEQGAVPPQKVVRSTLERQHPHRAGRIRVDKRFSTAISIAPEGQSSSNGKLDRYPASRWGLSKLDGSNNYLESSVDLCSKQTSGEKTTPEYIPSPTFPTIRSLDDSDEDDDELLNFAPFPKTI